MRGELAVLALDKGLRSSPQNRPLLAPSGRAGSRSREEVNLATITDDAPKLLHLERNEPRLFCELARGGLGWSLAWLQVAAGEGDSALLVPLQDREKTTSTVGYEDARNLLHVTSR